MNTDQLLARALKRDFLSAEEGQFLFEKVSTPELMFVANELRKESVPSNKVTWADNRVGWSNQPRNNWSKQK